MVLPPNIVSCCPQGDAKVIRYTIDYRNESRDKVIAAVCDLLGLEKTAPGTAGAKSPLALLPAQVPRLPEGYRARHSVVEAIKSFLRVRDREAAQSGCTGTSTQV